MCLKPISKYVLNRKPHFCGSKKVQMPFIISRPRFILLISFWLLSGASVWAMHKFYFSATNIALNAKDQSLECELRFFRDDFELALQEKTETKVSLTEHFTDSVFGPMVQGYVSRNFSVEQKGSKLLQTYIGYESDDEHVTIYIEVAQPETGEFVVKNSCLMELFDTQKNVINFQVQRGGDTRSEMLLKSSSEALFIMP